MTHTVTSITPKTQRNEEYEGLIQNLCLSIAFYSQKGRREEALELLAALRHQRMDEPTVRITAREAELINKADITSALLNKWQS